MFSGDGNKSGTGAAGILEQLVEDVIEGPVEYAGNLGNRLRRNACPQLCLNGHGKKSCCWRDQHDAAGPERPAATLREGMGSGVDGLARRACAGFDVVVRSGL